MNDYLLPDLPACPTEDSDNCIWHANVQGNGEGQSFYTILGDTTYFAEPTGLQIDPAPLVYLGITIIFTLAILRLRAITIRKK